MIAIEGTVQGVGFRPYVHSLATARNLHGFVRNDGAGLTIDVQGDTTELDDLISELVTNPPPLARIARVSTRTAPLDHRAGFRIAPSDIDQDVTQLRTEISADVATCDDCLRELLDPADRRYRYPFINCTQCGPRFSIVTGVPYDRPQTTMSTFLMCERCREEYENPADRRFHAQPIACDDCGPMLELVWPVDAAYQATRGADPISAAAGVLSDGGIVAIKGLGGYHLACDATSVDAIGRLRARKNREAKPLAVMGVSVGMLEMLCEIKVEERALLESRERPIVLLGKRIDAPEVAEAIAPRNAFIGGMLPYTPLHHLLLRSVGRPLVMTSGNLTDEPIAFEDDDAAERILPIADLMIRHNRRIATRCDDSVMRVAETQPKFIRRSRGFTPRPITLPLSFASHTLAVGGHLKNTFCLGRDDAAFVSHHIGDLENASAYEALESGISHFADLVNVEPVVVAHDLHPSYMSTQIAERMAGVTRIPVQHHHAHIASCMAENALTETILGVAFDGAGFGDDGAIWGGEFLLVGSQGYKRVSQLAYVPLPGGDAAVKRPLRVAVSHLWSAYGEDFDQIPTHILERGSHHEMRTMEQMLNRKFNSPPTSSVGRLFDAVAALAGIRDDVQFEGQAAMELEACADLSSSRRYTIEVSRSDGRYSCDPGSVIRAAAEDFSRGVPAAEISTAFHYGVAGMVADVSSRVREDSGVNRVALSGGVFQNALLTALTTATLKEAGFEVFQQRLVPCNDGGLSLGQAYVVALASQEA